MYTLLYTKFIQVIRNLRFRSFLKFEVCFFFLFSPKVRLDPVKMHIIRNDNHFADSRNHDYGSATTCCPYSNGARCRHTWFRINLSGTGLRLNKQLRWVATGRTRITENSPNERNGIYFISCKGSCGECKPSDDLSLSIIGCWKTKKRILDSLFM